MVRDTTFEVQGDYELPLLRLLYELPHGQGKTREVCHLFEAQHGERIPEKQRVIRESTRDPIWENNVRWCRHCLKNRGLLDMPKRGIWRITAEGRRWIQENPDATRLPPYRHNERGRTRRSSVATRRTSPQSPAGITLDMLERTRQTMPSGRFRRVWGELYDESLARERAGAITQISQTELGRRARRRLDEIHAFLLGSFGRAPTAEMVCEWIHFSHTLGLYRESAALLSHVREDEVEPGIYQRARRLADVSKTKER